MRIALFAAHFYPRAGGVEHYALNLARELKKRKQDVLVVTYRVRRWPHTETKDGVTIIRLPCIPLLDGLFPVPLPTPRYFKLCKQLNTFNAELVITNTRFNLASLKGALHARKKNSAYIHVEHGNQHTPQPNRFVRAIAWAYDHTLGRLPFRLADQTVVISKPGRVFARKLGAKRITYIPNSIDTRAFTNAGKGYRKTLGIPKERFLVAYVGRLVKAKGIHDLIKAAARITNTSIVFVGDGPDARAFRKLANEEGVDVRFLGRKQPEAVRRILSDADLFVNPSYAEGLPTSVLEAAAVGTPIIATHVGGTPDVLPKKMLVQPGDVTELAKKMDATRRNPERASRDAKVLRDKIRKEYDMRANGTLFFTLIKSIKGRR